MITHILKDGTVLKDITGHLVTRKDAPTVYTLLERKGGKNGRDCISEKRSGSDRQLEGR